MKILKRRGLPDWPGYQPRELILCEISGHHPYVTWKRNDPDRGGDGGRFFGHYYKTLEEAEKDFQKRLAPLGMEEVQE
jgi:hypothetical protein